MLNSIIASTGLTAVSFLICTAVSLALGVALGLLALWKNKCSQSFAIALAVLPTVVQVIIMLVNGNLGVGVAVAGTFGLVRFRSAQGTAREITFIFLAMALGLMTGMGYVLLAACFFVIMAAFLLLLGTLKFGAAGDRERTLKITVPESMDYEGVFEEVLDKYTARYELERVKTTGMGTLYELSYKITLKTDTVPKELLDELRVRNGNLAISCGRAMGKEEL